MTVSNFYKGIFGTKAYKISVSAGCTCPNRDGKIGFGGCIFCSQAGSGDFVPDSFLDIEKQIEKAKNLLSSKLKNQQNLKYIAYFQNFTNTYGDLDRLKSLWFRALDCPDVSGISIATRPDCLSDECLKIIGNIAKTNYVQVELGLQSTNEKTAGVIRRGYENQVYFDAVKKLHAANRNIHVVSHVIFGLPGETERDMMKTVCDVVNAKCDGIKITNLYVLAQTDLQKMYEKGEYNPLQMEEYFDLLKKALKIIPVNMVIHRLTGDPPKKMLIAPEWTKNKKLVLSRVNNLLCDYERDVK